MLAFVLTLALLFQEACSDCGKPLKEGAKFCAECGAQVQPKKCPGCGARVEPKERFCSECGKPLREGSDEDLLKPGKMALEQAVLLLYVRDSNGLPERLKKAESLLREAVEKAPHSAGAHYLLGRVWELEGESEKADACWRKAIELDPKLASAHCMLGRLLLIRWTLDVFRDEDRKGAIELFRGARRDLDGELAKGLCDAMLALVEMKPKEARRLAEEGIRRFGGLPGVEDFHCVLGLAAEGPEVQVEAFSQAIRIRPNFPMAHCWRATAYESCGRLDEALADSAVLIRLLPRNAHAFVRRARIRRAQGDLSGALEDCDEAIHARPAHSSAYVLRASLRQSRGDVQGAIADCDQALEIDPTATEAWLNRGNAHLALKEIDRASKDFTEAIRLEPTCVRAYVGRAVARASQGELREAITDYSEAIRLDPRLTDAYAGRGWVRERSGDRAGAVADLERALEVAPKDWSHRAAVEKKLKELRK